MMARLRWMAAHLRTLGPGGWLAIALALGSLVVWLVVVRAVEAETLRLEQSVITLTSEAASRAAAPAASASAREQLDAFARRFIADRAVPSSLNRIMALARKQGVQLEQGEFRWSSDASEPLARYTAQLPVKGSYRAIRRFSQDIAEATPGLAIEEIQLRRADPRSRSVDAQLRLVLFVSRSRG